MNNLIGVTVEILSYLLNYGANLDATIIRANYRTIPIVVQIATHDTGMVIESRHFQTFTEASRWANARITK